MYSHSKRLQARSHSVIPGGAHTYAKGDDQYPQDAPAFIARGAGCHVWDVDGNEFIEYGMGLRSVALGHAYPPVLDAVRSQLANGCNFTRPAAIEVECAEALLGVLGAHDRLVKFAKNGSDATTAAVKLARAYTGRDLVAICADHPFFSTDDWFIGTTAMPAGVPKAVRDLTISFRYNDIGSVRTMFERHASDIACLVMEVETTDPPRDGFLREVRRLCDAYGTLLVFDEMITGFRWDLRGAQQLHGVAADLTAYGKALGNGFAIAALVGRRAIMELGGLETDRERVFLLSTTYGAETHAMAAAIATIGVYQQEPVIERLYRQGRRLGEGVTAAISAHGLTEHVGLAGRPCNLIYATRGPDGERSQEYRTLFLQELLRRGVIAPSFVVSYSHSDDDIDRTVEAIDGALAVYARALADGVSHYLVGRPVQPVFRPYK